jgi:thiol-disulfide isomerase/thioredoxin
MMSGVGYAAAFAGGVASFLSPCVLPLVPVYLSLVTGLQQGQGAALLAAYSAGLGVPFLAAGLAFSRLVGVLGWVRRHPTGLTLTSALLLAGFGVLLTLDGLIWVTSQLQTLLRHAGLQRLIFLGEKGDVPMPKIDKPNPGRTWPRRRARWPAAALAAVVLLLVTLFGVVSTRTSTNSARSARAAGVSTDPALWSLPALNGGGLVALSQFRGHPTVVNFFASSCSACYFELPGFAAVSRQLTGRVSFVGVDALETGDPNYLPNRDHITWWPMARDVGGAHGSGLHDALGGGNAMPLTAFYDPNGKLAEVERGALPETALRLKLQQLFGIPPGT